MTPVKFGWVEKWAHFTLSPGLTPNNLAWRYLDTSNPVRHRRRRIPDVEIGKPYRGSHAGKNSIVRELPICLPPTFYQYVHVWATPTSTLPCQHRVNYGGTWQVWSASIPLHAVQRYLHHASLTPILPLSQPNIRGWLIPPEFGTVTGCNRVPAHSATLSTTCMQSWDLAYTYNSAHTRT